MEAVCERPRNGKEPGSSIFKRQLRWNSSLRRCASCTPRVRVPEKALLERTVAGFQDQAHEDGWPCVGGACPSDLAHRIIEGGGDLPVGTVVTQQLGIRRHEGGQSQKEPSRPLWWMRHPMLRALMKLFGHDGSRPSRGYPEHVPKSDEENIEKCWDSVRMLDDEFIAPRAAGAASPRAAACVMLSGRQDAALASE